MCLEARINGKIVQEQKLYLRKCFVFSEKFILENVIENKSQHEAFIKKKIVMDVCASVLSCSAMSDSATLWTIAHQALLSMGFSRREY